MAQPLMPQSESANRRNLCKVGRNSCTSGLNYHVLFVNGPSFRVVAKGLIFEVIKGFLERCIGQVVQTIHNSTYTFHNINRSILNYTETRVQCDFALSVLVVVFL